MNDAKEQPLTSLNQTLTSVENELLRRKSDRDDENQDDLMGQLNQLADDGVIAIGDDCPDTPAEGDDEPTPEPEDEPSGDEPEDDSKDD